VGQIGVNRFFRRKLDSAAPDDVVAAKELSVQESISKAVTLEGLVDDELLEAVEARQLGKCVVMNMDDEAFAKAIDAKDFKALIGARPSRLIHELRRQHTNSECETCCRDKKDGMPHCSDAVGADVTVVKEPVVVHGTRGAKRQKQLNATVEHFFSHPGLLVIAVRFVGVRMFGTLGTVGTFGMLGTAGTFCICLLDRRVNRNDRALTGLCLDIMSGWALRWCCVRGR